MLVITAGAAEWALRTAAVLLWLLWWWWARRVAGLPRWWWALGELAAAVTLHTQPTSGLLDALTGQRWVSLAAVHAAVVAAGVAAVEAQGGRLAPATSGRLSRFARRWRWPATGLVVAVMSGAWLLGTAGSPVEVPAGAGAVVALPVGAPMVAHQVLFVVAVLVEVAVFALGARRRLADQPAGVPRRLILLTAAAAALVGAGAAVRLPWLVQTLVGQPPDPAAVTGVVVGELIGLAGCAVAAGLMALPGRADPARDVHTVAALRDWLDEHLGGESHACRVPRGQCGSRAGGDDVLGLVVETRDRIAVSAQRRVSAPQVTAAAAAAVRLGLRGRLRRGFTLAVVLEIAAATGPAARPPGTADLAGLGGGRTPAQELRWLALVARIRAVYPAAATARRILRELPSPIPQATSPASAQPVDPIGDARPDSEPVPGWGPADDAALTARCRSRLGTVLAAPPRSLGQLVALTAAVLDAPVAIEMSAPPHPAAPVGAWVQLASGANVVWVNRWTSPLHRVVICCHEFGHILCGHRPTPLDGPAAARHGAPAGVLARCGHSATAGSAEWVREREAEITGRLLAHALLDPARGLHALLLGES